VGHGIRPDYRPNAFQYDEQCDEMICPEGRRLKTVSSSTAAGCRSKSMEPIATIAAAARNGSIARPERDAKHGRTVSMRIEPDALRRYHAKMETASAKAIYKQRAPVAEFRTRGSKTN